MVRPITCYRLLSDILSSRLDLAGKGSRSANSSEPRNESHPSLMAKIWRPACRGDGQAAVQAAAARLRVWDRSKAPRDPITGILSTS